jgi:predicted 3-demethylubiquinone-9 3-methyltransferase (glyoxalase superfamily)
MQKITPFLWFNNNALEAAQFYTSVFSDSAIISTIPGPGDTVMGLTFQLNGQNFMALNGGPMFTFTEAISLYISCETQEEIDTLWNKLTADGGKESRCGWLKDKYGLSWQLVPPVLGKLLADPDREKAGRVMQAMLQMNKIIIADLQKAYDE